MERCYVCGRKLGKNPHQVDTGEDQAPYVGSECYKLIQAAGTAGWQPKHGPRLYLLTAERQEYLKARGLIF